MHLKVISTRQIPNLLAFERDNRSWFERYIEARPHAFYSRAGVTRHVQQLLEAWRTGIAYPGIIEEHGQIIGRVNLTKVAGKNAARLGYRVGFRSAGRGVASFGVAQVLERVNELADVNSVIAFVSVENIASQRVLARHGFRKIAEHDDYSVVGGKRLRCREYELVLR
jgi:ribosomal-protein-alanine N-acetyltransferase